MRGKWEPIETAPKDGTVIDIWASGQRWADFRWSNHAVAFTDRYGNPARKPTHWMPLPEPPAALSLAHPQPKGEEA